MAIIRPKRGMGLKFEDHTKATTPGLETMRLTAFDPPKTFMEHAKDIPIVGGSRFHFNQGSTGTCVANAFLHAVILRECRDGLSFDEPARLFPYWFSRFEHNSHRRDDGTYLFSLGHALRAFGCPSERHWKWSTMPWKVNRRPNHNAMRWAQPRKGGRYVRIYEMGDQRIAAVQQALMNGHDVAFGTRVHESFMSNDGGIFFDIPDFGDPYVGNHAMLIIGWAWFDGRLYFRVMNSWGKGWRDKGFCWMSAEYIAWPFTQDLHAIYGWERSAEAA